jgi:uncharacterized protein (DUF58 family)
MATKTTDRDFIKLLPQDIAATVGRMELLASGLVEGFISGRHKSPHKGFSVEFAEHRPYVRGDDLGDLDWRVYGKTDRYYIKQYTEETNLRTTILLDASGSMKFTGEAAVRLGDRRLSKFEYGQRLAAALTYLMIRQQDAVGLVTFDTKLRQYIPAKGQATQVRIVLEELNNTKPGGETAIAPIFHDVADRIYRRGLVIIISDLFDNPDEIIKGLYHFHYSKHEVVVLHVMAEEELQFPFEKFTHFRDLELNDNVMQIDPKAVKALYLERVREFIGKMQRGCGQMKAAYVPVSTANSVEKTLVGMLARRRSKH